MKTKHRVSVSALCLLVGVFCVVALSACNLNIKCIHKWGEWSTAKAPTCTESGVQERKCSKCGETATAVIDASGHDWEEATCTDPKTCKNCLATEGAATGHIPCADDGDCTTAITCSVCGNVTTAANASHTGGTATCKDKAVCEVCGKEYGELAEHTGETVWIKHLNSHYLVYSCCYQQATEAEEHTKTEGACTVCGFNPTVTISSAEVTQEERQLEIVVSIADNPGITGLAATVQYSSNVFELTAARDGEALNALTFTSPSELKNGCKFLWDGVEIKDENIRDGEFLILTFAISEGVPEGDYTVLLKISAYDNELNPISPIITGGKITIHND